MLATNCSCCDRRSPQELNIQCQFWGSDSFDEVIDVLDKRVVLGGKYFASLGVFFAAVLVPPQTWRSWILCSV